MSKIIKKWKFDHNVYQDEFCLGVFGHQLTLLQEPVEEKLYPIQNYTIIWEIPALGELTTAQISTIDKVIHDHRNLFEIPETVLEYLYNYGFCLDNSINPNCFYNQTNYNYDEQA